MDFLWCALYELLFGGESPLQAWYQELLAKDKGVNRQVEFEESRRQNVADTRGEGSNAYTRRSCRCEGVDSIRNSVNLMHKGL